MAQAIEKMTSIYDFDNLVTAPCMAFRDTDDYGGNPTGKQWPGRISKYPRS